MSDWIKIGVEFIKALPGQWKGSSDPNAPSEIVDTMAEDRRIMQDDDGALRPPVQRKSSPISVPE
jgi:hypothetical protein